MSKVLARAVGALWISTAIAAGALADPALNASGALPGDDALTCDQVYAQGMAESQRDQQARSQRNDQLRRENATTAALVTGAMLTGGMGGTGQAANMAAETQADKHIAMLGAPPPSNPRMDHLKQLWAQKHCVRK